jgi:hypothetical protein
MFTTCLFPKVLILLQARNHRLLPYSASQPQITPMSSCANTEGAGRCSLGSIAEVLATAI